MRTLLEGKKILIAGAGGQCGRGLCFWLSKGNEVHALSRFSKPGIKEEIEGHGCTTWVVDMGLERPDALPTDFDVVINEAVSWEGDDDLDVQNRSFHLSCQFIGDLMYRNEKATFALVSTGSVYKAVPGTCKEDETPVHGGNTYVTAKIAMTQVARWIGTTFNRPWCLLRYFYPFTAYDRHRRVDKMLDGMLMTGNPAEIFPRTYIKIHIENTIKALDYARPEGEIFNSATTDRYTVGELAKMGAQMTGAEADPRADEPGDPNATNHVPDIEKVQRLLGPASISMEEALRRYIRGKEENIETPQEWMFAEEE